MAIVSGKARERLLYLISPIALIAIWQVLEDEVMRARGEEEA